MNAVLKVFALLLLISAASTTHSTHAEELQPGDEGYKHDFYHPYYQTVFDSGRCQCSSGQCRATIFQVKPPPVERADQYSVYQVQVNRRWCQVPKSAMVVKDNIPKELLTEPAHVCAYPRQTAGIPGENDSSYDGCPQIECVMILMTY